MTNTKIGLHFFFAYGALQKKNWPRKVFIIFFVHGELEKRCATFAATKKNGCDENVARPKSRVALSLVAAVAPNGYFDPNVSPAQQRNKLINAL